ncbi:hypothetical protein Nepgr_001262 [Nepenthes gracilis]|uniref:Uncharacterized protein n=1 Tax=Nepenthes gracilis TaxID=150966 RepID=A0AAD3P6T0_NEPGR|nr:hypothetical protein Nepgr_001262 [Nepenthes gracilis]
MAVDCTVLSFWIIHTPKRLLLTLHGSSCSRILCDDSGMAIDDGGETAVGGFPWLSRGCEMRVAVDLKVMLVARLATIDSFG